MRFEAANLHADKNAALIARQLSIKITRRWWSIFDDNVLCFSLRVCVLSRIARRVKGEETCMYLVVHSCAEGNLIRAR